MKIAAAVILATALVSQGAYAKTLEDVLKEKGVITEEDYKEVNKSRPVDYKLGEGFTFTSPDEKFKGSIGSSMQLRYSFTDMDSANNTAAKTVQDSSKFELRRIKLFFNGYAYSKDLTYKLQLNFAEINNPTSSNGKLLEETYMNYRIIDEAQLRFGQDKVPFARQEITSTSAQQFVDRSVVTDAFKPGYDTGLMLHGKISNGLVNYNAGVYGGAGQDTWRTSNDNAFAARIAVNPFGDMKYSESDVEYSEKPLLSVGTNYFFDTLKNGETNNINFAGSKGWVGIGGPLMPAAGRFAAAEKINFNTFGFDTAFKWKGLSVQGEYFIGQADGQTSNNTLRAQGFYAQAGYFIIPKQLELAARYSYLDANRDAANSLWIETQGAVSWYINKHNLKLQADITNIHKQSALAFNGGPNATDDMQARLQAQIIF
ncbi:MAG TPA: porin [Geobacteraceae bacterium]|nr:porin [Geobacteraceae bacterium]